MNSCKFLNTKRMALSFAAIMLFCTVAEMSASYPDGYYNSLEGKCGVELMRAVKSVAKNHKEISYGDNTWKAFESTDVKTVNGVDYWWDMYSSNLVKVSSGHPDMNIEHSVANSWWGKTKNAAYKDIVHLNPSDKDANSRKSNYPLAELASVTWDNGVTFVGKPKSGQGGGASNCFEPKDEYKGDFARVFMYMFTIYNDISWKTSNTNWMYDTSSDLMFKQWARELLLRWSANDPVSDKERYRNDGIYKEQNNRNPFIDLPDLAEHIWGSKSNVPYSLNGTVYPDPDPDPTPDPEPDGDSYSWLNSTDATMGDWTIENIEIPSAGTYVWQWSEYNGSHYMKGSAYISGTAYYGKGYIWSPVVSMANVEKAEFSFNHAAKFQTTIKDLCKMVVRDADTKEIFTEQISTWPAAKSWTYSNSGIIDLSKYSGKNIQVGFLYESNTSGADTWQINDVKLNLKRIETGVDDLVEEDEDDSFLVEVWGNNILIPQGAKIFDMNGREVNGEGVDKGIYIVVKPGFKKAVKVAVGR